jgi:hypothetical protein
MVLALIAVSLSLPINTVTAQIAPTPTRRGDIGGSGGGVPTAPPAPTSAGVPQSSQATPPPIGGGAPPSAFFSNLTFSTAPDGPAFSTFAARTTQIYARFNFTNVPAGSTITRTWYLNNAVFITRSEAWTFGTNGRVSNISIFDFTNGLPSGSYYVTIALNGFPNTALAGSFVILGTVGPTATPIPPTPVAQQGFLTDLTTSTSPSGPVITNFAAGTQTVYIRFNYYNIPIGTTVRREWFLNGALYRIVEEPWSYYWGNTGRLTHIYLYDYRGLPAGSWTVRVTLPALGATIQNMFSISGAPVVNAPLKNLTFSVSVGGPAYTYFYYGTREVVARWQYVNPPTGVWMVRRWYRNGVLFINRREVWNRGGVGTSYTTLYDYQPALQPGNYYVEIELEGVPNSKITGSFRIG